MDLISYLSHQLGQKLFEQGGIGVGQMAASGFSGKAGRASLSTTLKSTGRKCSVSILLSTLSP